MRRGGRSIFGFALVLVFASAVVSQTRSVTIISEPSAKVFIDGVLYGKTNKDGQLEIRSVAAGGHTLMLRCDGFKEKSQPFAAATRGEIKIPLVKTTDEAELAFQDAERLTVEDRDKAIAAYQRAIKLRPNFPEAYVAMARVQADALDVDGAKKSIQTARRLRPGYAEASAVEGRIHKDNDEEALAVAAFKRAIVEGHGFQPEAYAGLGLLYKEKAESFGGTADFTNEDANYAESAKDLKVSLKQLSGAPDSVVIYQLLGLIYERQKKWDDAIALYEEFLRLFPNLPEADAVRSFIVQIQKERAQNP